MLPSHAAAAAELWGLTTSWSDGAGLHDGSPWSNRPCNASASTDSQPLPAAVPKHSALNLTRGYVYLWLEIVGHQGHRAAFANGLLGRNQRHTCSRCLVSSSWCSASSRFCCMPALDLLSSFTYDTPHDAPCTKPCSKLHAQAMARRYDQATSTNNRRTLTSRKSRQHPSDVSGSLQPINNQASGVWH